MKKHQLYKLNNLNPQKITSSIITILITCGVFTSYCYANEINSAENNIDYSISLYPEGEVNANYLKADSGIQFYQGSASDTTINSATTIYWDTINCDADFEPHILGQYTTTTGGFSFTSGTTYYQDANSLYSLANAIGINTANIHSAQIQMQNTIPGYKLLYCIPNLACSVGSASCVQSVDSDFGEVNLAWSFLPQ